MINEARYIQSYAKIIGVKEEAAISYAQKKGTLALINNASGLLTTKTQREKHKAFLDLYRMSSELHHENPVLSSPEAVTSFIQSVMEHIHDKEAMMAVFLDTKNRVIDYEEVSLGTINSSIVHPREIFRGAVINKANAIILCHNNPSGDLTPSGEDKTITLRLKETGKLMGIEVLDHVIISGIEKDRYYSFKESGVLEETIRYGKKIQKETDKENKSAPSVSSSIKETGTNYEVTDAPFEAFITNLGKYNEGELVGEWVAFPTDRETLQEVFKRIGIGSENELGTVYEESFISDYDCRIGNLYNVLGEYESLNELNYLASKIEELSENEKEHFEAAMEISNYAGSVKDLINLTENLDRYEVYPGIEDYDDPGRMYIDEYGILKVPDPLICDETLIKLFGEKNKSSYAHILIDMEIQKAGLMPLCNNFSKNATQERISAIMKTRKTSFFMIVLATILFMGVTVGFATSAKKNDDTIQTSSNHTIYGEIDKNLEKIQIDINSAAIDFIELEGKQNIFAEFDPAYYEVNIQNKKRIISVKINSKTGNNNALPIKLYIPSKFSQYIDMNVKNGSVDMNGIFANSKFVAKIESSNIDFTFNKSFAGVFDADVKESSMNFVSMNNYKNFEIDITSNNAIVDMPDYFKKTENKYTYSNGNKDAKIKLILDEYSVADFQ